MKSFGKKGIWVIFVTLLIYMFTATPSDALNITIDGFGARMGMATGSSLLIYTAIGGFVGVPVALLAGKLIEKKGVRLVGSILLFVLGASWALNGLCHKEMPYALTAILMAAVAATVNLIVVQQIMSNWFPKKKGAALGIASAGMPISSATMVTVFQVMILHKGLSAPFFLMLIITVVVGLLLLCTVKDYPEQAGAYPDNEPLSDEELKANLALIDNYKSDYTIGKLFRTKDFWLLVIVFSSLFITLLTLMAQMIPRLGSIGMDVNTALMWLTIASLVGIPTSFLWGFVDQKFGTKSTCLIYTVIYTVMVFLAAIGSGIGSIPISVVSVVMLSCLHGGLGNLMPSMVINVFGRYDFNQVNKYICAFVLGIRNVSFIIVPVFLSAAGLGNEALGYRNAFIVFGVLCAISIVCTAFISKNAIVKER